MRRSRAPYFAPSSEPCSPSFEDVRESSGTSGPSSAVPSPSSSVSARRSILNVHFHTLALDGVYTYTLAQGAAPRFLPLPPPSEDEVARVLAGTARRIQRLLEAGAEEDADAFARDEPLVALLAAASLRTRIATGAHRGEPWRRLGDRIEPHEGERSEPDPEASARVPQHGGMSLHADVSVPARDRQRPKKSRAKPRKPGSGR